MAVTICCQRALFIDNFDVIFPYLQIILQIKIRYEFLSQPTFTTWVSCVATDETF